MFVCFSSSSVTQVEISQVSKSSEMLKIEISAAQGGASTATNTWARTCDTCHSAASAVYCHADVAYLCTGCDARVHAANQVASRHERVWVCEACERAPAAFVCKADSASLCSACDADIHSANPLARRHHRVPILPIQGTHYSPSAANPGGLIFGPSGDEEYEDEATSWLLFNPIKNGDDYDQRNDDDDDDDDGPLFGGEVEKYLDLDEYNSCQNNQFSDGYNYHQQHQTVPDDQKRCGGDRVVPIQFQKGKDHHCSQLGEMEFEASKAGYGYPTSMSQSASLSSMDVGVVPESRASEISVSHTRPPKGTIDLFSGPPVQIPTQLSAVDREAQVSRYREKKKNRKFEKTIRYASRKAYAETRPRIKGRFAKRTDVEVRVEQMFSTSSFIAAEGAYGVVPSF